MRRPQNFVAFSEYLNFIVKNATPIKLFSVDSYDLNTRPFKFDIFTTFEMPIMYSRKNNFLLLFCPFASEVLGPVRGSSLKHKMSFTNNVDKIFL